jgi:hypothetical protein
VNPRTYLLLGDDPIISDKDLEARIRDDSSLSIFDSENRCMFIWGGFDLNG